MSIFKKSFVLPILSKFSFITNYSYYLNGSFWLLSIQFITIISGFLFSLIYAKYISAFTFGQYTYIFSLITFLNSFTLIGMDTAVIQAVAKKRELIVKQAIKKTLPWVLSSSFSLFMIGLYYFFKIPSDPKLFRILSFCSLLTVPYWLFRFYEDYYLGKNQLFQLFKVKFITNFVSLIVFFITVLISTKISVLVIVSISTIAFLNIFFTRNVYRKLNTSQALKSDFDFASQINTLSIFTNLVFSLDKIIVAKLLGFEAVAIYAFAQFFPDKLKSILKNYYTLSLVKLSSNRKSLTFKKVWIRLGQFFAITLVIVFSVFFLIKPIFALFYPNYMSSVYPAKILLLSLLSSPALILQAFFESQKDVLRLKIKTYGSYIMQLILLIILTLKFGIIGTAWAITISRLFSLFLALMLFINYFDKPLRSKFNFK